jgi:hypothetical protein
MHFQKYCREILQKFLKVNDKSRYLYILDKVSENHKSKFDSSFEKKESSTQF